MTTGTRILGGPERHDCEGLGECIDHPRWSVIANANAHYAKWAIHKPYALTPVWVIRYYDVAIAIADHLARGDLTGHPRRWLEWHLTKQATDTDQPDEEEDT